MDNNEKFEQELDFVSSFYREDAFRPNARFRTAPAFRRRRIIRWAAASLVAVSLGAGAVVAYRSLETPRQTEHPTAPSSTPASADNASAVKRIEFTDTPLSRVAEEVEKVYGVELENLPTADTRLTISYTGDAADCVEAINEILGSSIRIKPCITKKGAQAPADK